MSSLTLLTPGPTNTSDATKAAMLHDWGSWDGVFNTMTASICRDLLAIVHGEGTHVCVPMQGSGTFAVEAALGTLVPSYGRVLVLSNGAYCERIVSVLDYIGIESVVLAFAENQPVDVGQVHELLSNDLAITHVALVHCETTAGLLNPLQDVAAVVAAQGRRLIVDAMSSFGVLPIDLQTMPIDALIASSGKCLEGVPGLGFVIVREDLLRDSAGQAHSLSLDLHDQWGYMQRTGRWRFTPPTHVVAALRSALNQYIEEGGRPVRFSRYTSRCKALREGMQRAGFVPFLSADAQAPIIVAFHDPADPNFDFDEMYRRVRARGFILYPGKLTAAATFRVGCIGAFDEVAILHAIQAIVQALHSMGIYDFSPAAGAIHPVPAAVAAAASASEANDDPAPTGN